MTTRTLLPIGLVLTLAVTSATANEPTRFGRSPRSTMTARPTRITAKIVATAATVALVGAAHADAPPGTVDLRGNVTTEAPAASPKAISDMGARDFLTPLVGGVLMPIAAAEMGGVAGQKFSLANMGKGGVSASFKLDSHTPIHVGAGWLGAKLARARGFGPGGRLASATLVGVGIELGEMPYGASFNVGDVAWTGLGGWAAEEATYRLYEVAKNRHLTGPSSESPMFGAIAGALNPETTTMSLYRDSSGKTGFRYTKHIPLD